MGMTICRRWRARTSFSYCPLHSTYEPAGSDTFSAITRRASSTKLPTSRDRKSTRLNSSHITISYAVFCLKKKTNEEPRAANQTRTEKVLPEPEALAQSGTHRCTAL